MTSPFSQFCFASSPVLFSGCYDPLAALHSSWFRAAPAPYRLRDSTLNFSVVQRDLALPIPAQLGPRPSVTFLGHCPSVHRSPTLARPGGCWARSISVVALERRPGPGRRRSRPTVRPLTPARVWACASPGLWPRPFPRLGGCRFQCRSLPNAASAWPPPPAPQMIGPCDRSGNGTPCSPAGALARPATCNP